MPRPKRPGQTSASPGRANINLGGVLGAAGAGSDNAGYVENAPANTPDVAPGDSADAWQNFMDSSRDNKYLTAGGALTNDPATDTRNWIQRVTGKPDVAGSINANLLAQRAGMPLQQQQSIFDNSQRTKSALDTYKGQEQMRLDMLPSFHKLDNEAKMALQTDLDNLKLQNIPKFGAADTAVDVGRRQALNTVDLEQQPKLNALGQDNAFKLYYNTQGLRDTPEAQAAVNTGFLGRRAADLSKAQADEVASNLERDRTNITREPALDASTINAFNDVEKAKIGFNKTGLDSDVINNPNYRSAYGDGQIASAALPVANLNKAMQLNVPSGDTVFTPPAVGYDLPTQHPGMMFQGVSHIQTQAPDKIMTDSKGVRTAIPSDKMITTPLPPQARGYHEEGGELYGIQKLPVTPTRTNNVPQMPFKQVASQLPIGGAVSSTTNQPSIDPKIAALIMQWLQSTNGVRR